MTLKKQFTNDTLEEELREICCEQQKQINQSIKQLKKMIAEESEAKYRAYVKFADLQKQQHDNKTST